MATRRRNNLQPIESYEPNPPFGGDPSSEDDEARVTRFLKRSGYKGNKRKVILYTLPVSAKEMNDTADAFRRKLDSLTLPIELPVYPIDAGVRKIMKGIHRRGNSYD